MAVVFYVILAVIVLIPLILVLLYNSLVRSRNMVEEGWSGIDVQLTRRADLVPNLVETVKGYAAHEKSVLEEITAARTAATSAQSVDGTRAAANQMTAALGHLFAVAEAYPDLKADANFRELQTQLAETEDMIQKARRYYNGAVRRLNTGVEQFPGNLVARQFGFERAEYFEIEDPASRALPKVDFGG